MYCWSRYSEVMKIMINFGTTVFCHFSACELPHIDSVLEWFRGKREAYASAP